MEQLSKEWFETRKGKLTASNAGAALGINPWKKPDDLIRQMVRDFHGAEKEFVSNIATNYGQQHEPLAVLDFMSEYNVTVEDAGFYVHPEYGWLGASPDGFVGGDGLLEIKCPFSLRDGGVFKKLEDQPHYYAQVQVQMACTGKAWTDFYQWAPHATLRETVRFNEKWWIDNLPVLLSFYHRYINELDNPAHLKERTRTITGKRYETMIARYDELRKIQDEAKAEQQDILDQLVQSANEQSAEICGRKLTRVDRVGSVSYAKVVKDHLPDIDLEPYRGDGGTSWRLT